ncbi:MAG: cysteine desulfurase [Myxococcota bacterium]|nr:cysteine desulfurase [Myxococcota bacterium]
MIYFDHNASTPVRPEVSALLVEAFRAAPTHPGNASSVHQGGREARTRLDRARAMVAQLLGAEPREVVFTGSGSEADALALKGAFFARADRSRNRIVLSRIEHPAVRLAAAQLSLEGAEVVEVSPGPDGRLRAEEVIAQLDQRTLLCSLMLANNETGVLQPVNEVARACRERGVLFHVDAVQAVGKVPVTLREVHADLLAISGHKFGAPLGVGVLVVRRGLQVASVIPGNQENGLRGGSSNVVYAEALALALALAVQELPGESARLATLRDRLEQEVLRRIPQVSVNGAGAPRIPNTTNLKFDGADGESLLIALDLEGICVSAGAACSSGSVNPSPVLSAMGLRPQDALASLRFSLGGTTTGEEVERVVETLVRQVPSARSPG